MTEFIQDNLHPQFLSPEAVYFLRRQKESFDTSQSRPSYLGSTALDAASNSKKLYDTGPRQDTTFIDSLYTRVLVCFDRVNPVVLGKRHHPSHEYKLLQESELFSGLLTAGSLAAHALPYLSLEQRQYAQYCQQLTQRVAENLDQLGLQSLDEAIQRLRTHVDTTSIHTS